MIHPNPIKRRDVLDLSRDPVKHYVRLNGWLIAAKNRFSELEHKGARRDFGLRYFTLCGKDGIDIFLFKREGLIKDNGRGFPSVLYCESYRGNYVQVRELLGKTPSFLGIFEDLIKTPWFCKYIAESPFDILNLDFSGSCFPKADYPFSGTLKSITKIIEFQKGNDFDLFITFKAHRSGENDHAITQLTENMERNFAEYQEINNRFKESFGNINLSNMSRQDYGRFLLATFPKIVFGFGSSNGFIVKCLQKFKYGRRSHSGANYEIVKFIFSFRNLGHSTAFSEESRRTTELATNYRKSTLEDLGRHYIDVDNVLMQNKQLRNELEGDFKSILDNRKAFGTYD